MEIKSFIKMKTTKRKPSLTKEGSDYPLKKIIEIIETFGFFIDCNSWTINGWIRIRHTSYPNGRAIILYKDHLETNVHSEKEYLRHLFQDTLIAIGEDSMKIKINNLLHIEQ